MSRHVRSVQTLEVRSLYLDYSTPHDKVLLRHLLPLPKLKHLSIDSLDETHIAVLIRKIAKNTYLLTLEAPVESHLLLQLPMIRLTSLRLENIYTDDDFDNMMVIDARIFRETQRLRSLAIDHAGFSDIRPCESGPELPQLDQLELRLPRSTSLVHRMCIKLETLVQPRRPHQKTLSTSAPKTSVQGKTRL